MQVCFRVGVEESEGEQMGSDGVGDGVNGIKWINTQIQYEMRPSLEGSSSLILQVV